MNPVEVKSTHIDAGTYAEQKTGGISSSREKCLVIVAFIFGVLVLCLLCAIIMTIIIAIIYPNKEYCLSEHCVKKAGSILRAMNTETNPCDDFYKFACGGWMEEYERDDDSEIAVMGKMQKKINRKFDKIIQEMKSSLEAAQRAGKNNSGDISEAAVKAIKTYDSCSDLYNKYDPANILPFMDKFGGWPMAQNAWSNDDTLSIENKLAAMIGNFDTTPLFSIGVEPVEDDPTKNIIIISLPSSIAYFENSTKFLTAIKIISKKLKGDGSKFETDIQQVSSLANEIKAKMEAATDSEKNEKIEIRELRKTLDGMKIDWEKLFRILLESKIGVTATKTSPITTTSASSTQTSVPSSSSESNLESVEISDINVIVRQKEVINEILKVIDGRQDSRELHNYFAISVLLQNPLLILKDYEEVTDDQSTSTTLENKLSAMKANCLQIVSRYLNYAMDHVFIYKRTKSTRKAEHLIFFIKKAFWQLIKQYPWLDIETRRPLLTKLKEMNNYLDYPKWIENKEKLNDFYTDYEFDNSNPVAAYCSMIKFSVRKSLETYSERNDRNKWPKLPFLSISTVNAFYIPSQNNFILPRAILNPPIYDENNPMYLTFGSIGAVIGHEITHGFDTTGRHYDETGKKSSFWTVTSKANYETLTDCFIQQYNKFEVDKQTSTAVNGTNTLSENIADNGGLREAFKAYRLWLDEIKNGKKELPLPGLGKYSAEQMFFISYGQTWCVSARKEYLIAQVQSDEHTPNKYRVIGTLSNMKEFSKAFQCPSSSRMNPIKKCILW